MSSIYDKSSLVLIPSGTKTGKVFSQKPVSGDGDFTFTRASAATRVNADGNIEKETQNLLLQSNTFDTTWTLYEASLTSGQSGYDGSNDAWKLIASTTTAYHEVKQNLSVSGVQTFSVYAKAGGYNYVLVYANGLSGGQFFNLSNGTKASTLGSSIIDSNIEDIGSGWYRCSITFNATNSGCVIQTSATGTGNVHTGDGTSGVYIQDAQLEQGLVARDYIETTTSAVYGGITDNVPRLDYTDSSCPALLLEPQRTNLVPHSEYFGAWNKSTGAITITSNYGVSPEGLQNSSRVQFTSASQHINISTSLGTGVTSTGSVYIKGTAGETIQFDTGGAGALKTLTGDWQRIEVTSTSVSSLLLINTFGGATARDIEVWGAQCEQASYATSYIPTYGSSVTRVNDDITTIFSSPIPTTGNVSYFIHLDGSERSGNATGAHAAIRFAGNDYISYNNSGGGFHRFRVNINGTSNYYTGNLVKSQEAKLLAVINGNYIKIFMNGQQVNQGTLSGTPDLLSATQYTGVTNEALGPLPIKELLLISTALTDQEAIDLTTI